MNVRELREHLADQPDEIEVLVLCDDGPYREVEQVLEDSDRNGRYVILRAP